MTHILIIKKFNSDKVGFLDLDYKEIGIVINKINNIFYQNIYTFIDGLKDMK